MRNAQRNFSYLEKKKRKEKKGGVLVQIPFQARENHLDDYFQICISTFNIYNQDFQQYHL